MSYNTCLNFRRALFEKNGRIDLALPEKVLEVQKRAIAYCDNIEMAANYKKRQWQLLVKHLYADFWKTYQDQAGNESIEDGPVRVGKEQDDLGGHYDATVANRWIPSAMVTYSDALGKNTGIIDKKPVLRRFRTSETLNSSPKRQQIPISTRSASRGVRYASVDDSLAIGYLESDIYHNSGAGDFVEGAHIMENMLIATTINNELKNCPTLSLVHETAVDGKKKVDGYLMAYEGKLQSGPPEYVGQSIIYIEDMAVQNEAKIGGGAMLLELLELYKANYLEKGVLVPIFMQARESTSFELIVRKLQNISEKLNLDIQIVGDDKKKDDPNYRHSILLVPKHKVQAVDSEDSKSMPANSFMAEYST